MASGWNVCVTVFDPVGNPGSTRNYFAYEPDKEKAVELVREKAHLNLGEGVEAVADLRRGEFISRGMRPGDVRHIRDASPELWLK
jgi:hypothetical protein